jgi:hypothetical protein
MRGSSQERMAAEERETFSSIAGEILRYALFSREELS